MKELLLKISRWWNGWAYVPKHSNRGHDEFVIITFP